MHIFASKHFFFLFVHLYYKLANAMSSAKISIETFTIKKIFRKTYAKSRNSIEYLDDVRLYALYTIYIILISVVG